MDTKKKIYIVQSNDGYYINAYSFHTTRYGADWQCAHDMNEYIDDDNTFEANKLQVREADLKT